MILVVGGAGYIGAHVCKRLHQEGLPHLVYDSLLTGHRDFVKWGPFIQADLGDEQALEACFSEHPISAVMHFSALTNVGDSVLDPLSYYQNNTANTLNLLKVMMKHRVHKLIFSSTCAIYGEPQTDTLSETHPKAPINPYGHSKLMVETMVKDLAKNTPFRYAFLRYFNAAGADPEAEIGEKHSPETHLIPLAIEATKGKRTLTVFGQDYPTPDGTCIRDYIHVCDLAEAHVRALRYLDTHEDSIALNLGSGQGYSILEILDEIARCSGVKPAFEFSERRHGDPAKLTANNQLIQATLGWAPQHDLESIIKTALNWHRTN